MKLPSSLPNHNTGMTYAQTLKTTTKKEKGGDNIPEFLAPSLDMKLERKLQILPGEFCDETRYLNDDTAALYAHYFPT